jgi:5-carboxymethyl-2-hydroxymuconate isomerase
MPHLTLEYTSNLRDKAPDAELLLRLHRMLESVAGVRIDNCKSRWREVDRWAVGAGVGESAFVHLDIRVFDGRPEEVRRTAGVAALDILRSHFLPAPQGVELQITVEVREIRRSLYFKHPPSPPPPPRTRHV